MIKLTNPITSTIEKEVEVEVIKEIVREVPVIKEVIKEVEKPVPFDVHHHHENPINYLILGYSLLLTIAFAFFFILSI
jgi:hypothetical protein